MVWEIRFYSERIRKDVEAWPAGIRAAFIRIADRMESHGPNLGMPLTRAMGGGLFEIRCSGREGTGRVFYCTMIGGQIVILHAMVKKSQKTPAHDLDIARKRLKEVKDA